MTSVRRKTITRWLLPDGTRVPAHTPGATKHRDKTRDYYGFWTDDAGKEHWIRLKNCRDKTAALIFLVEHLQRLDREAAGLGPPLPPPPPRHRRKKYVEPDDVIEFY